MQAYVEAFRAALASLMAHRLRSFLTTLGILIGTASVIAVVSLVQGMSESIKGQFAELGGSTMSVEANNDNDNYRTGRVNTLTPADISALQYRVPGVLDVAPVLVAPVARASYRGRTGSPQVIVTNSAFQEVRARYPQLGRFLTAADDSSRRRVAVIGEKVR